ncbi:hypothetical protein M9458_042853, partial [Cirrhinus mrigala]
MDPSSVDHHYRRLRRKSIQQQFTRLTTEVSAQANVLASHQQQLSSPDRSHGGDAEAVPSPVTPPTQSTSSAAPIASPRLAYPDKFDGT